MTSIPLNQLTSSQRKRLEKGCCIDCAGPLLAGPCGGASQNVLCSICGEEFNLMGPFGLDRMGKNPRRAQQVYGFRAEPMKVQLWLGQRQQQTAPPRKSFWRRMFS